MKAPLNTIQYVSIMKYKFGKKYNNGKKGARYVVNEILVAHISYFVCVVYYTVIDKTAKLSVRSDWESTAKYIWGLPAANARNVARSRIQTKKLLRIEHNSL